MESKEANTKETKQGQEENRTPVEENLDDLDKALEDMDNKLNLTADAKDDEGEKSIICHIEPDISYYLENFSPELEKEFSDFMSSLNKEAEGDNDPALKQFSSLMGKFLETMKTEGDPTKSAGMKSTFDNMASGMDSGNIDDLAKGLLVEFMDKDILLELLQEADKNYDEYLEKNKDTIPADKM